MKFKNKEDYIMLDDSLSSPMINLIGERLHEYILTVSGEYILAEVEIEAKKNVKETIEKPFKVVSMSKLKKQMHMFPPKISRWLLENQLIYSKML